MRHNLKTDFEFFKLVWDGKKTAEWRYNDREFCEGDSAILHEYDRETEQYSGRKITVLITHVLEGYQGMMPKWAMLSFQIHGKFEK